MNISDLRGIIDRAMTAMPTHADELRELDAALGDGDLGITVAAGSRAVQDAVGALDDDATADRVILAAGKAFMNANPSTFAALVGGGLLAASRTVKDKNDVIDSDAHAIITACMDSIAKRGKTALGDKTVLDTLDASINAFHGDTSDAATTLDAMIDATEHTVTETAAWKSAKGRAAWMQDRSIGLTDPGSMAYLFLLRALRDHWNK